MTNRKYRVGDKVVPIKKSAGFPCSNPEESIMWVHGKNQGFLYVKGFDPIMNAYYCHYLKSAIDGDYFIESDLKPYQENQEDDPKMKTYLIHEIIKKMEVGQYAVKVNDDKPPYTKMGTVIFFDKNDNGALKYKHSGNDVVIAKCEGDDIEDSKWIIVDPEEVK